MLQNAFGIFVLGFMLTLLIFSRRLRAKYRAASDKPLPMSVLIEHIVIAVIGMAAGGVFFLLEGSAFYKNQHAFLLAMFSLGVLSAAIPLSEAFPMLYYFIGWLRKEKQNKAQ